jgi:hypothetical protein
MPRTLRLINEAIILLAVIPWPVHPGQYRNTMVFFSAYGQTWPLTVSTVLDSGGPEGLKRERGATPRLPSQL